MPHMWQKYVYLTNDKIQSLFIAFVVFCYRRIGKIFVKKSCIRETNHLSTDADSSTDTTVGLTKNTQKTIFFEKRKKLSKTQKLKIV